MVAPTIQSSQYLYDTLSERLEDRVFTLSSKIDGKQYKRIFQRMHLNEKSVTLISTPKYAHLFRDDIDTIVIENETNSAYNTLKKPFINMAHFISIYANLIKTKLILADTVLSMKTHSGLLNGNILALNALSLRTRDKVNMRILDMRQDKSAQTPVNPTKEIKHEKPKQSFQTISNRLRAQIQKAVSQEQTVCILCPRRGLAPLTVCADCKTTVTCNVCDTPVTLITSKNKSSCTENKRVFICYTCGKTKDANTVCKYCRGWKFNMLGIGMETVENELKQLFKGVPIYKVDKESAKSDQIKEKTMSDFFETGGILLGTSAMFPLLLNKPKIYLTAVSSLDAMLSIPGFDIDEKVFSLLLQMREISHKFVYVQTRMPSRDVLTFAQNGDIAEFVRNELKLRKTLDYPPYTTIVKITSIGSKRRIIQNFQSILPAIEKYKPRIFHQFEKTSSGKFALSALLRIKDYPNEDLYELLKNAQTVFDIKVQ